MTQLNLFSDVDDFLKIEALNTTNVLKKYGYDTSATYEIIRMNYDTHKYELVVYSNGKDITVRKYDHIAYCSQALYEDLKDKEYEYSVEISNAEFIFYQIHKLKEED